MAGRMNMRAPTEAFNHLRGDDGRSRVNTEFGSNRANSRGRERLSRDFMAVSRSTSLLALLAVRSVSLATTSSHNSAAGAAEPCPGMMRPEAVAASKLSIHSVAHFRCSSISSEAAPDLTCVRSKSELSLAPYSDDAQQPRRWAPNNKPSGRNASSSEGLSFGSVAEFDEAIGYTRNVSPSPSRNIALINRSDKPRRHCRRF